jgi:HD-GYP domain-containing protein (c-di-GMP phosphodiesterase class II)
VAIPLGARVICVCDAFDAMVSNRPYRSAMRVSAALEELRLSAGTQFDPSVVQALVDELTDEVPVRDARIA